MITGTIQNQVKMQMLDTKWQQKKQNINSKKTENMTKEQRMLEHFKEQAANERKRSATSELYTKLQSGGTLTAEEIAYLKENDPQALADYERAQAEKKAYENALKNCKTKEEVDRLKLNRMGNFAAQAKSIANSPYIPKDKKLEMMQKLNNEVCLIRDAHNEFVKSRVYEELPEEAEVEKERVEETTAKNDEIQAEQMKTAEEASDENVEDISEVIDETSAGGTLKKADVSDNKDAHSKTEQIKGGIITDDFGAHDKKVIYEQVIKDIERYLRKNGFTKSSFAREV